MQPTPQGLADPFYNRPVRAFAQQSVAGAFATPTLVKLYNPTTNAAPNIPLASAVAPGLEYRVIELLASLDRDTQVTLLNSTTATDIVWGPHTLPLGFGRIPIALPGIRFGLGNGIYIVTGTYQGQIDLSGVLVPIGKDLTA